MPCRSLEMRSKKTCNSCQWICLLWGSLWLLVAGSGSHLRAPLGAADCRHSPPCQAPTGSPWPWPVLGLSPCPSGVSAGPWLAAGPGARVSGHLAAPKACFSLSMAPTHLPTSSPVVLMSCG